MRACWGVKQGGGARTSHEVGPLALQANHRLAQVAGDLGQDLGVVVVGDRLHDGARPLGGVARLEDAGADEDAVAAQLHHQRRVRGGGHAASREVDHRQAAQGLGLADQVDGGADLR